MVIYEKEGYVRVEHKEAKGYIAFTWEKFGIPLEDFKQAHLSALAAVCAHSCPYYIADTSKASGSFLPQSLEWFSGELVGKLHAAGLVATVTVVPASSALAKIATRNWQSADFSKMIMENAGSLAEAETTVAEIKRRKA